MSVETVHKPTRASGKVRTTRREHGSRFQKQVRHARFGIVKKCPERGGGRGVREEVERGEWPEFARSLSAMTLRYINARGDVEHPPRPVSALMLRRTRASLSAAQVSHQLRGFKRPTGTMGGQHKDRRMTHLWILTLLICV